MAKGRNRESHIVAKRPAVFARRQIALTYFRDRCWEQMHPRLPPVLRPPPHQAASRRKISEAFVPPKPKELDSTTSMLRRFD